jgi:two-component system, OmpR family, sensor kinase
MRSHLAHVGLRWRLAGWIALVILICSAISFVAVYNGTGSQLRRQIDTELRGDSGELARSLQLAGARTSQSAYRASNRYVRGQPFAATSTLLFTLAPGARTSTNRPELFTAEAADNGETASQQNGEDRLSRQLLTAPLGYRTVTLPDVGALRLLKRAVRLRAGGPTVIVGTGEPLASVAHAQAGVARAFIRAGALALAAALLGAYLIGTRVSRPLRHMAAVAARVDAGDLHPRIHDPGGESREVRVLIDAFNRMLDRLTDAFAAQRAFVADASHELRTPLTVIAGQLEVLAAQKAPSPEEVRRVERLVQAEIARIGRLVDDLLLLAKTEQAQFLQTETIDLPSFVGELWDGMTLLARRSFELGPVPPGSLRADPDRLAQALRNLIGNAIAHTAPEHGLVRMRVEPAGGARLRFIVEDDGPGIAADQRDRVFDRFHRTDAARDRASGGTGLGLAIVRAIADAHGGRVSAEEAAHGGARLILELGRFAAAATAPATRDARPVGPRVRA